MMRSLILGVTLFLIGCGGAPSSLDLCHDNCNVQKKCGVLSDAAAANCHSTCDSMKGTYSDQDVQCDKNCKNCADVRNQLSNCGATDCNKVASCVTAVDQTCIAK